MRICIIGTNVFALPPQGYSGLEALVYNLSEGLARKGHSISVVCPEGSRFTQESIEPIYTQIGEAEETSWVRYKGRLEQGEWPVVIDASWQRWANLSNQNRDPQIPILNWHHTDPSVYGSSPPVQYPMWVGLSRSHAENLSRRHQTQVRWVYNGVDLEYYKQNGKPRGDRCLWVARYTPTKAPLEIISLAQRLRMPVDMFGDTQIIEDRNYVQTCFNQADGYFARVNPGITREATVDAYSTHKALLNWLNWEEPFGLVVIEAQACGCPPIAARRGAMPELIQHGKTGFLCDTLEEMEKLIQRDAAKEIDPVAMRKWVERKFSLEKFIDSWETLILKIEAGERW